MNHKIRPWLACLLCMLMAWNICVPVLADEATGSEDAVSRPVVTHDSVAFVYSNRVLRVKDVSYYADVYAYDRRAYAMMPFDAAVPERFFVVDSQGANALASIVLDVCDAVRIALYGEDVGKAARFYGQYTEKARSASKEWGYSGIHEGLDFIAEKGHPIYAVVSGEVVRAGGDKDGTVAIYNARYNTTVLYLHVRDLQVKTGQNVEAGTMIGREGDKGATAPFTHIEVRFGRHRSPNPYRNAQLESDLPYDFFVKALGIEPSEREPITAASVYDAEQRRLVAEAEAEAARLAAELAEIEARRQASATPVPTPTPSPQPTPVPSPTPPMRDEADESMPEGFGFSNTPVPEALDP